MPIFTNIPFNPQTEQLQTQLRIQPGSRQEVDFRMLLSEALAAARPKAVYQAETVVRADGPTLAIGGIKFSSALLHEQLSPTVYPFAATCGRELAEFSKTLTRPLHKFWLEYIQISALNSATQYLQAQLAVPDLACLTPGSLPQWNLEQLPLIFELLGDAPAAIGIQLMPNCLMKPLKSVSGIYFRSADNFSNCRNCSRLDCPTRQAPYQAAGFPEI